MYQTKQKNKTAEELNQIQMMIRIQEYVNRLCMGRTVGIGHQDYEEMITQKIFYVDKTDFIREWWESIDEVTLITRPRRFGKTLNLSMVNCFFSVRYADRADLFEGMVIWNYKKYRMLQGTFPVISISFANLKGNTYEKMMQQINQEIYALFASYRFLYDSDRLDNVDRECWNEIGLHMSEITAVHSLKWLSTFLFKYYGQKPLILMDEYDTPMHEAFTGGFWDEIVQFFRSLFNTTFKTNPYRGKSLITGITRVSKESMFSDMNNLCVVTTTTEKYETAFGFTEEEVFAALEEQRIGSDEMKTEVKKWYDGFRFGRQSEIYNPWSITYFLKSKKFYPYWVNTSSNGMLSHILARGDRTVKYALEDMLRGRHLFSSIDEEVTFDRICSSPEAVWSLMLASGYLKMIDKRRTKGKYGECQYIYEMDFTNKEVRDMVIKMIPGWFTTIDNNYNSFIEALLANDVRYMNLFMNDILVDSISYFDSGKGPSHKTPERFYHGLVLGLLIELKGEYEVKSNRESGFGRYDVMLRPRNPEKNAYILEFKVRNEYEEADLKETVQSALTQIKERKYAAELLDAGIPEENIFQYGFAFEGKSVLIG